MSGVGTEQLYAQMVQKYANGSASQWYDAATNLTYFQDNVSGAKYSFSDQVIRGTKVSMPHSHGPNTGQIYSIPPRHISGGTMSKDTFMSIEMDKTHSTPKSSIGSLETEESPDTIVAYKYGKLVIKDKELRIAGAHSPDGYGIDAEATCHRRESDLSSVYGILRGSFMSVDPDPPALANSDPCVVPGESCQCGFYAYKSLGEGDSGYGQLRLQVELYGKVVVHERGMRASHQRVLKVTVPCCDRMLCRSASTHMVAIRDSDDDYMGLGWRCNDHVRPGEEAFTLNDLAGMLGTEVQSEPWTPCKAEAA